MFQVFMEEWKSLHTDGLTIRGDIQSFPFRDISPNDVISIHKTKTRVWDSFFMPKIFVFVNKGKKQKHLSVLYPKMDVSPCLVRL